MESAGLAEGGGFGIGAVAQTTGVDQHTLRIWERRYGFPRPQRSATGLRLYTSADVGKLKLIAQALARGHRPRQVVGKDLAALETLVQQSGLAQSAPTSSHAAQEREEILGAVLREDIAGIRLGLRRLAMLLGPRQFVVDVAHPLAVRVGELWEEGTLEVHQEHLLSDCLSTQLRLLRSMFDDARGPVVLLTTLPGEPHALGLEMIALYLATGGVAPRVLGVSTPVEQIARAARAHRASAVGLAVMPARDLSSTVARIRRVSSQLPRGTRLWLGGGGAEQLPRFAGVRVPATWPALDAALRELLAKRVLPGSSKVSFRLGNE